jgi:hypothetical protein
MRRRWIWPQGRGGCGGDGGAGEGRVWFTEKAPGEEEGALGWTGTGGGLGGGWAGRAADRTPRRGGRRTGASARIPFLKIWIPICFRLKCTQII